MFIIDLTLKNTAAAFSVQRKTAEDANALYQSLVDAMRSGTPDLLEVTCEFQVSKRISLRVSEVSAVQISEKASTSTASGRVPGFLAVTQTS